MKAIMTKVSSIETKEDFLAFMELLVADLKAHSDEWENKDLASYLDAIASWTEDMDGFFMNFDLPKPENVDWKTFATILHYWRRKYMSNNRDIWIAKAEGSTECLHYNNNNEKKPYHHLGNSLNLSRK